MFNSSKEIAELKAKLEELNGQLATANETINGFATIKADFEAKLTAAAEALAAEQAAHAATTLKLTEATEKAAKATEDFEAKVSAALIERCAAAGIDPIASDPKASQETGEKNMKREAFNKLTPHARREFVLSGGKITD